MQEDIQHHTRQEWWAVTETAPLETSECLAAPAAHPHPVLQSCQLIHLIEKTGIFILVD